MWSTADIPVSHSLGLGKDLTCAAGPPACFLLSQLSSAYSLCCEVIDAGDELKEPDYSNTTDDTEKDAEIEEQFENDKS